MTKRATKTATKPATKPAAKAAKNPTNSEAAAGLPVDTYKHLQAAFDYFNAELFDGALPAVMLTINASKRACYGYFYPERFVHVETGAKAAEINVNADQFSRGLKDALSTLVHEMAHHWQAVVAGRVIKNGYHDKEWGDQMEAIGLMPSNTGEPGGKRTGRQMTHYIIEGGRYELAFDAMPASIKLDWHGIAKAAAPKKKRPAANKTKFTCPKCGANAWGKPDIRLLCAGDDHPDDVVDMVAA